MQDILNARSSRSLRRMRLLSAAACLGLLSSACSSGTPQSTSTEVREFGQRADAVLGTDSDLTVLAADTVLNQYTTLAADAAAADTTLSLGSVAALTSGADALAAGDLLLVIQMQGALLDSSDANSATWGSITLLNGAGSFEFVEVTAVDSGTDTVTLSCALGNSYTTAGKTQVIRVPQYDTLTIAPGGTVVAPAWDGATGGVVAVHARTTLALGGAIDVSALGFRGGAADNTTGAAGNDTSLYASAAAADGGQKGEGIGGYLVSYGRAPAANGGGGGNSHNGGGGGGSNGDVGGSWTGLGTFDEDVTGASAWSLDPLYTTTPSPGGGRGGYTYSNTNRDALAVAPGNATWTGNNRRDRGGLGGHVLDNDPGTHVFLGGGGGAGDGNDNQAGAGGVGGGIVFVLAGQVTGAGVIRANGADGVDAISANGANGDAPGGGGAGGSVVVQSAVVPATLSIEANGGEGGTQGVNHNAETEGPGAGGGGGYIWASGSPVTSVGGGIAGTTTSPALAEFPTNGATRGSAGRVTLAAANAAPVAVCLDLPDTAIDTNPDDPSNQATGDFTFSSDDSGVTFLCTLDNVGVSCSASFTTATLADGSHTLQVAAQNTLGNVDPTPATFTWTIDTTGPDVDFTPAPAALTSDATPEFSVIASELGATFECRIDSDAYAACTSVFTPGAPLGDGPYTVDIRALDALGNPGLPAHAAFTVDTTPPDTSFGLTPNDPSTDDIAAFTFDATEEPVTFECKLDAAAFVDCTTPDPYLTEALAQGSHTLSVRATDAAGNVDLSPAMFTWEVDSTALALPNTSILLSPPDPADNADAHFEFGSDDDAATFSCSLDGGSYEACDASETFAGLTNGPHTIAVRAENTNGFDSSPAMYSWTVQIAEDGDGDGVLDADEQLNGTDPADADSDDDGVTDGAEPSATADSDGDGLINALDPDSDNDGLFDGTELSIASAPPGTDVSRGRFVPDADTGSSTNPLDPDTDQGGVPDGQEDTNHNGRIDASERDPNAAADDATALPDRDHDDLSDAVESLLGTDPDDADSDDDGVIDGREINPTDDTDGDGLINPLDADSDNDGLADGTELGLGCGNADTDVSRHRCVADADKDTTTSPVLVDSDNGGVSDGSEDANLNGALDDGESDPTVGHAADDSDVVDSDGDRLGDALETFLGSDPDDADSDDDGVPDGAEANPGLDDDEDGQISVLDADSDGDRLFDGTESGQGCDNPATDLTKDVCIADADPSTITGVLIPDTDHGGEPDGSEDSNHDGKLDGDERNPLLGGDDLQWTADAGVTDGADPVTQDGGTDVVPSASVMLDAALPPLPSATTTPSSTAEPQPSNTASEVPPGVVVLGGGLCAYTPAPASASGWWTLLLTVASCFGLRRRARSTGR